MSDPNDSHRPMWMINQDVHEQVVSNRLSFNRVVSDVLFPRRRREGGAIEHIQHDLLKHQG